MTETSKYLPQTPLKEICVQTSYRIVISIDQYNLTSGYKEYLYKEMRDLGLYNMGINDIGNTGSFGYTVSSEVDSDGLRAEVIIKLKDFIKRCKKSKEKGYKILIP